jgi:hypothetical protein
MKDTPFTIVYRSPNESSDDLQEADQFGRGIFKQRLTESLSPDAAKSLNALNPNLSSCLIDSSCEMSSMPLSEEQVDVESALKALDSVLEDLRRASKVETVAVWDLDAHVGELPALVGLLNSVQTAFTFLSLQAPLPAGLVARREHFLDWAHSRKRQGRQRIQKKSAEAFENNLMSSDFYSYAHIVHRTLGVNYTIGITRQMIAGYERGGKLFWNYFADSNKSVLLVSTYNLREYARQAGRPFEVALAGVILSQLLVEVNKNTGSGVLQYHEDTGCLFDFNDQRDSIVRSIKEAKIDEDCLGKLSQRYRKAAVAMIDALKTYAPEEESTSTSAAEKEFDDSYWLDQLTRLGRTKKD